MRTGLGRWFRGALVLAWSTSPAAAVSVTSGDGLALDLDAATGAVAGVWIDGVSVIDASVAGGLYVRDRIDLLSVPPATPILTPNPSFEIDSEPDGMPDGWQFQDGWGQGATMTYGSDAFDGARSVTIHGAGGAIGASYISVTPGSRYFAQAQVKGSAYSQILVVWFDSDENYLFYESGAAPPPSPTWVPVQLMMTAPQNAAFAEVRFYAVSAGDATFDLARAYVAPAASYSSISGPVSASGSDLIHTASLAALGLDASATYRGLSDRIEIDVVLTDRRGGDRALDAGFVTPVQARRFWDNPVSSRVITQQFYGELFAYTFWGGVYNDGHWGDDRSIYPMAAVTLGGSTGIAMGYDILGGPQDVQFFHSTHIGESFTSRFRLGIAPEPLAMPRQTRFRLSLFKVDGGDGFRSALERYYTMTAPAFESRIPVIGGWTPWRRPNDIPFAADFGIGMHTYHDDVLTDDALGVLSFGHLSNYDYWLPLGDYSAEPTLAEARARLQFNATDLSVPATLQAEARAALVSALHDVSGEPVMTVYQRSWMPGSGWSAVVGINPDPDVRDRSGNGWPSQFDRYRAALDRSFSDAQSAGAVLDGAFFDWFRGSHSDAYNHRREHFETCGYAPSFDPQTSSPALPEDFAHWEAARAISDDMRARGLLTMARDIHYPSFWATGVLDAIGEGLYWDSGEDSIEELAYFRAVAGRKPYMLTLDADFSTLDIAHALRRALLHGLFLTPEWDNGSGQRYWDTAYPARDRDLFRHFVALWRLEHQSGWRPTTRAVATDPAIRLERWGDGLTAPLLFSVWNGSAAQVAGEVAVDLAALGVPPSGVRRVVDLVDGRIVPSAVIGQTLRVSDDFTADAARLYHVHTTLASGTPLVLHAVRRGGDVELSWNDAGRSLYELLSEDGDPRLGAASLVTPTTPSHVDRGAIGAASPRYYAVE